MFLIKENKVYMVTMTSFNSKAYFEKFLYFYLLINKSVILIYYVIHHYMIMKIYYFLVIYMTLI